MPVQLQGDMIDSRFWQDVKRHLDDELSTRKLGPWTVVIRQHAGDDDESKSDNADHSAVLHYIDHAKLAAEFVIPNAEKLTALGNKGLLVAKEVAAEFAHDLEIAVDA
jgi:hypothetical protein